MLLHAFKRLSDGVKMSLNSGLKVNGLVGVLYFLKTLVSSVGYNYL